MKTSTEIGSLSRIVGEEKAIEYIAKAGFDAWDFSMFKMVKYDYRTNTIDKTYSNVLISDKANEFAKCLRKIGEDNGIICNQSHAPFPICCKDVKDLMKKSIELTAIAGGEICVIHPDNYLSAEENAEFYFELLPFAKQHNVKIATENMWFHRENEFYTAACSHHDDFKRHIDCVNDDFFVACVDIGHAELKGSNTDIETMLKTLGNKVKALHIHDNDFFHDSHQIPFSMCIDFEKFIKTLHEIKYDGYLTLEADAYLKSKGYIENPENVFEGVKELAQSVDKLRKMYEAIK